MSRVVDERIELMRRSSSVRTLGSVGQDKHSSNMLKLFRRYVRGLHRYQYRRQHPQADMANGATSTGHEQGHSSAQETSRARSSDIGHVDTMDDDTEHSGIENKGTETELKDADSDGNSSRDRNKISHRPGLIYVLPKAATQARALVNLGIPFIEQAHDFAVASGLDESQIFDIFHMTRRLRELDGLWKMTRDCLLRTPTGGQDSSLLGSDTHSSATADISGPPYPSKNNRAAENIFDEDVMYASCPRMSRDTFHEKLKTWKALSQLDTSTHTDHAVGLPSPEANPWRLEHLLGWTLPQHTNIATGQTMTIAPRKYELFESFLDGLWLVLSMSKLSKRSGELQTADEKLLGAVFTLVTTLHRLMERAEQLPYHAFYHDVAQCLSRMFQAMNDLETHALTIETVHEMGESVTSRAEYSVVLKHTTIALLLATKALKELRDQTDILEGEKLRRDEALAKISSAVDSSADYIHVEECCNKTFGVRREAHRQKRFQQGVERLEGLGWNTAAARTILLNECRRRRINYHADFAARMLEASFLKALAPDPSKKIHWKAAALPTDLVALLISQVLERPVLDGQDALGMYMRYVTSMVSLSSRTPDKTNRYTDIREGSENPYR